MPPGEIGILTPRKRRRSSGLALVKFSPPWRSAFSPGCAFRKLRRLDCWSSVDSRGGRGLIEVTAQKSKTAQRRLVTFSENLRHGSHPLAREAGPVAPQAGTYRRQLARARRAAGIEPWPRNALRHSFASYHFAFHRNAAETALQLGHTESRTLFAHYRELVRPEDAKAFWQIFP